MASHLEGVCSSRHVWVGVRWCSSSQVTMLAYRVTAWRAVGKVLGCIQFAIIQFWNGNPESECVGYLTDALTRPVQLFSEWIFSKDFRPNESMITCMVVWL